MIRLRHYNKDAEPSNWHRASFTIHGIMKVQGVIQLMKNITDMYLARCTIMKPNIIRLT